MTRPIADELEARGIDVYPSGQNYVMIHCPMDDHDDNSPSCSVSLDNGSWRCFGCGESGPYYHLISMLDGITIGEAKKRLQSGESIDTLLDQIENSLDDEEEVALQHFSLKSFLKVFPSVEEDFEAYGYMINRGFDVYTLRKFMVRYGDHGKYRGHVVIPIFTMEGNLLSYMGRVARDDVPRHKKTRKARSPVRTLFGINHIPRKPENIVVVEGELDAMYLQQFGIGAVATMGSSISTHQIRLLRSLGLKTEVILCFDDDEAGSKATEKVHDRLAGYMKVYNLHLPDGKDPNDLTEDEVYDIFKGIRWTLRP